MISCFFPHIEVHRRHVTMFLKDKNLLVYLITLLFNCCLVVIVNYFIVCIFLNHTFFVSNGLNEGQRNSMSFCLHWITSACACKSGAHYNICFIWGIIGGWKLWKPQECYYIWAKLLNWMWGILLDSQKWPPHFSFQLTNFSLFNLWPEKIRHLPEFWGSWEEWEVFGYKLNICLS